MGDEIHPDLKCFLRGTSLGRFGWTYCQTYIKGAVIRTRWDKLWFKVWLALVAIQHRSLALCHWGKFFPPMNYKMLECEQINGAWQLHHQIWKLKPWISIWTLIFPDAREHHTVRLKSAAAAARERREAAGTRAASAATAGFRCQAGEQSIRLHRKHGRTNHRATRDNLVKLSPTWRSVRLGALQSAKVYYRITPYFIRKNN